MVEIQTEDGDSAQFIVQVNRLARGVVTGFAPAEILIIKVDNWFGPNWLKFSGKVLGALGVWKKTLTVPPFVPNRIVWERRFVSPDYCEVPLDSPLHITTSGPQATMRLVSDIAPDMGLLWFSGQSETNGRSALMAYIPKSDTYWTWYAGWSSKRDWKPTHLSGISGGELAGLAQLG